MVDKANIQAAADAVRRLWDKHGIQEPMKFLGFCLSILPLPVIQQAGQALDRHFSDDALRKELEKLWSDVSAANAKVASVSRLEEAILEIADTLQQHEEILRDAKKFSELLQEVDSTFTIQTEGRSYQQIVNSVIQAGRVLIAATDGSVNVIEGTQVHSPHTRLHASGGSKNYIDGTAFRGSEGSVAMQGISTQGNIHVSGSSIGFSDGSSLTFGGNPNSVSGDCPNPKCQKSIQLDKRKLQGYSQIQCPYCNGVFPFQVG